MDGGQRRTETWTSSRMERVSRVEPAAVRHAGGERSAQHRFPRGAAGIDKGSAAAPLVPFTAPVRKIFRRTHGERNPSTNATCQAPLPDGASAYPAYEPHPAKAYNGAVCASTTANATILTIRRTEAIGVNTCTGFATPINTGPTVTPSALETRSKL